MDKLQTVLNFTEKFIPKIDKCSLNITCQSGCIEGELAASLLDSFLFKPSVSGELNSEKQRVS